MMIKEILTKSSFNKETYDMSTLSVMKDEGKWFELDTENYINK